MHLPTLVLALVLGLASAACPNGCSGHGSCGNDDICQCYIDYLNGDEEGGDCSSRRCASGQAWVDAPSAPGVAHAMAECSGRGVCDRDTGNCECFEGYTGKACARTTCPNDCSGHGTCEYISELDAWYGDYYKLTGDAPTSDRFTHEYTELWDAKKSRACQCDPKWTELDCSRRMCPKGNYALYNDAQPTAEVQRIIIRKGWTAAARSFALTFLSTLHEEFTTGPIVLGAVDGTTAVQVYDIHALIADPPADYTLDTAAKARDWMVKSIEYELNNLPNKVIQDVEVDVKHLVVSDAGDPGVYGDGTFPVGDGIEISITFNGASTTGDQFLLECKTQNGGAGTQPMLGNLAQQTDFNSVIASPNAASSKFGRQGLNEVTPHADRKGDKLPWCFVDSVFAANAAVANSATANAAAYQGALAASASAKSANLECSGRGKCAYDSGICECFEGYTDEYCSTQSALI